MAMRNWVLVALKPATVWPSSIRFFSPSEGLTEFEMSMSAKVVVYEGELLAPTNISMTAKVAITVS